MLVIYSLLFLNEHREGYFNVTKFKHKNLAGDRIFQYNYCMFGGIGMWNDFKNFAFQGNVLDLAVAVMIGGAFGKIVTSLVENIMMPLIGILINGVNFEHLTYRVGDVHVLYGSFIQSVFDFFVIAISVFIFIRLLTKFKREEIEEESSEIDKTEELLTQIRDLLQEQQKD